AVSCPSTNSTEMRCPSATASPMLGTQLDEPQVITAIPRPSSSQATSTSSASWSSPVWGAPVAPLLALGESSAVLVGAGVAPGPVEHPTASSDAAASATRDE